jgi:LysM repeat protein/WD40 repeat protein
MIIVRRPEESVLALSASDAPADSFPSMYVRGTRDPYVRPSSVTPYTKKYIKRFTSNASTPAKTTSNFTGTEIVSRISPATSCEVKCLEVVDGTKVWAANKDGSFVAYDRATGAELSRTPQRDTVCWCMLEVGENVWCGFNDGFVRILAKRDKAPVMNLSRHTGPVTSIVQQSSGKYVFSASIDFTILQWDAADFSFAGRFIGHTSGVRSLATHVDRLFSGSDDGSIRAWDMYTKEHVVWKGHTKSVKHLLIAESNLWSASDDGTVRVWNQTGKCISVLSAPGGGAFTALLAVGSTVWASSVGGTVIWDTCTRAWLREIPSDGSGYVAAAVVTAKNVVNRVWAAGTGGQIATWNAETELRGDDAASEEEARNRNEEVLYLRDALQDVQVQAAEVQDQCNERLQRMQYDLQKARDEAEMRSCQIADMQAQLDHARREVAQREELLSQRDIRNNADANKSVNRVMANHLQQTEKKLLEAESRIQKLQSELSKEQSVAERRAQRDSESTATQSRALAQLQQSELRCKELQRHCDELEETVGRLEQEHVGLRDENVELAAKLDVTRKKIDEAQRIVSQHASELKTSNKERARLQALSASLQQSQKDTAPAERTPPGSPAKNQASASSRPASPKARSKVMPILPPKPWVERVVNYVRTVCASCSTVAELPEPMQQALRFEVVRARDSTLVDLTNEDANGYVENFLGPTDDPPELRGCLDHGYDSLSYSQQFALILSTMRLYNPAWLSLSFTGQVAWFEGNALFPSALQVVAEAEKTVASFTTLSAPRRAGLEKALKRAEILRAKPQLTSAAQHIIDRDGNVPTPVAARITKDLQSGWRKLPMHYRRAITFECVASMVPDWELRSLTEQRSLFERFFSPPSIEEIQAHVGRQFQSRETPETGVFLLRALQAMGPQPEQSPLWNSTIIKLVEHGKMRCPPEIESSIVHLVNGANPGALSPRQRSMLAIDFLTTLSHLFEDLTFAQARQRVEESGPKLAIDINDSEDITQSKAEAVSAAAAARCENWDTLSPSERLDWVARYCVLPPLLDLRNKVITEWPPVNSRPLASALMEASPVRNDSVAERMRLLDGNFGELSPAEQQVIIREVFFTHVPHANLPNAQREQWMQQHASYPTFSDVQPVLYSMCENGWQGVPPRAQRALLSTLLPPSDVPMAERYDMAWRFARDRTDELEQAVKRGLVGFTNAQQDALHRWFLGAFVAGWESRTESEQVGWMRQHGLLRGGKYATLSLLCDIAAEDSLPVPHLVAAANRASAAKVSSAAAAGSTTTAEAGAATRVSERTAQKVVQRDSATQFPIRDDESQYARYEYAAHAAGSRPTRDAPRTLVIPARSRWADLATDLGVDVDDLSRANNVDDPYEYAESGTRIVLPPPKLGARGTSAQRVAETSETDTIATIAYRYRVTEEDLIAANPDIDPKRPIPRGKPVRLPAPPADSSPDSSSSPVTGPTPKPHSAAVNTAPRNQSPQAPGPVAAERRSLRSLAARHGWDLAELQASNPDYRVDDEVPPAAPVKVPARRNPMSLRDIAANYGIPVGQLLAANPSISNEYEPIAPNQTIYLPTLQAAVRIPPPPPTSSGKESLDVIARRHGVDVQELHRANPSVANAYEPLPPNSRIVLPPRRDQRPQTIEQYARTHSLTVEEVLRENPQYRSREDLVHRDRNHVYVVPSSQEPRPPVAPAKQPSLADLADKYNVSVQDLHRANPHVRSPYSPLQPDERIVLPAPKSGTSVAQYAAAHNVPVEELLRVNPHLRSERDVIERNAVVLPTSAADHHVVTRKLQVLRVREPTTVAELARELSVTPEEVLRYNSNLVGPNARVPANTNIVMPPGASVPSGPPPRVHVAQNGDRLSTVAVRYGVSEEEVYRYNPHLRGATDAPIDHGVRIEIPPPEAATTWQKPSQATVYRVTTKGDNLYAVAHRTGVPVDLLIAANNHIDPRQPLEADQPIFLPEPSGPGRTYVRTSNVAVHHVDRGDTVGSVAHRYGVSVEELLDANPSLRDNRPLRDGLELAIPPPRPAAAYAPPT